MKKQMNQSYIVNYAETSQYFTEKNWFIISSAGEIESGRSSKLNFSSGCFIADDSRLKIVWLIAAVFSKHDILYFWGNVYLFKYYPVKVPQNCFNSFSCSNETWIQVSKSSFALDKQKSQFKVFVNCRNETVI